MPNENKRCPRRCLVNKWMSNEISLFYSSVDYSLHSAHLLFYCHFFLFLSFSHTFLLHLLITHTHLLSSLINSVYAIQHRWMSSQETAIIHIYQYIHRKYFTIYADNISTVGIVAVGTTSVENICFPRASNDSRIN